jgi:hypothetical protein
MYARFTKSVVRGLALAIVALAPVAISAQDSAKTAAAPTSDSPSKWDIFLGYSYLAPTGQVRTTTGISAYQAINFGGIVSGTRFFNNYVGAQVEVDEHTQSQDLRPLHTHWNNSNDDFAGGSVGFLVRFPSSEVTPFLHALVGTERIGGPDGQKDTFGEVVTAGGGIDYATPFHPFGFPLSFRIVQADFQYDHANFGVGQFGGRANVKAARLSSGFVLHVGTIAPPPPVTLACAVDHTVIFAGDPVTATATAGSLIPKDSVVYSISGAGSTGAAATLSIKTDALEPNTYTVNCGVKEGKPGKEGLKPWESASATATFTVKPFDPPTVTCSSNPGAVKTTDTSAITAVGVSPQNRNPLTYSYSASSGTVTGSGSSAVYTPSGAGDSTITCNVADKDGKTASATTVVSATVPYVAPVKTEEEIQIEKNLALHSVFFPTAQPREKTPEIGLVPSQEATLTALAADFITYTTKYNHPDAHLILTGHADIRGTAEYNQKLTDRRVARAKAVLVEKGISADAIETKSDGNTTELDTDQVKALVASNTSLSADEQKNVLKQLPIIVLAQNRRVDITLQAVGIATENSVQLYPFNAADSLTLLDKKALGAPAKKAPAAMKAPATKKKAAAKK